MNNTNMTLWEGIKESIGNAIKEGLIDTILRSFYGMLSTVYGQTQSVTDDIVKTPETWNVTIFENVREISVTVITPIAGIVLTYVVVYEFLQMIAQGNNAQNLDMGMIFKWLIKSSIAVFLLTNVYSIVMALFEVGAWAAERAGSIAASTVSPTTVDWDAIHAGLMNASIPELVLLVLESGIGSLGMTIIQIIVFVIVTGRMIQIYLVLSLAPIPFATLVNRELGQVGQNYIKTVMALSFQAVLIIVCLAIYGSLLASCMAELASSSGTGFAAFHGAILRLIRLCKNSYRKPRGKATHRLLRGIALRCLSPRR
jgi:hypothetical protein